MKWINKLLLSIVWVGLVASCSDDDSHELPVISPVSTGTFTDTRDDNTYNYVRIGNLEWMTENCRYMNITGVLRSLTTEPRIIILISPDMSLKI